MKIGIFAPAVGVDKHEYQRFIDLIEEYKKDYNLIPLVITEDYGNFYNSEGFFRKSKAMNLALASLIRDQCDLIIQTDIDCIFSSSLLDATIELCNNENFIFCKVRYSKTFHKNWEEYKKIKTQPGEGAWNAASPNVWKLSKGWNDELYGRGGEDIDLHHRIKLTKNIKFSVIDNGVVVHINHPIRKWNKSKQEISNHKFIFEQWSNWDKNPELIPNFLEKYL